MTNECTMPILQEMALFFGFRISQGMRGYVLSTDAYDSFCPNLKSLQKRIYNRAGWGLGEEE
jgi:hypothetical protein